MVKKLLIPTDFTVASIQALKEYLNHHQTDETYSVVFISGYQQIESIADLLFYKKQDVINQFQVDVFKEGLSIIENKYRNNLKEIQAFKNFLEANAIDEIVFSKDILLYNPNKRWFDIVPFINKLKSSKITITALTTESAQMEYGSLSPLFTTSS
jgi:hypothetical protein